VAELALGRYEEAARACERAIGLGSDTAWEHGSLGRIRLLQGRYGEAVEEFRRALAEQPANREFLLNLGLAQKGGGALEEAARTFERVLQLDPKDPLARLYAARAWWSLGQSSRALVVAEEGVRAGVEGASRLAALADSIRHGSAAGPGGPRPRRTAPGL
jgi:tetratricopeptide (TPR) repeat protein